MRRRRFRSAQTRRAPTQERAVLAPGGPRVSHGRDHVAYGRKETAARTVRFVRGSRRATLGSQRSNIAEMESRIEELQRQQLVAQSALAQQTRLLDGPQDSPPSQPSGATPSGEEPHEDPIQAERNRRAYASLFASNVALSYRKTPAAPTPLAETSAPSSAAPPAETPQETQLLKEMQSNLVPVGPPHNDSAENSMLERRNRKSCRRCGRRGQSGGRKNLPAV